MFLPRRSWLTAFSRCPGIFSRKIIKFPTISFNMKINLKFIPLVLSGLSFFPRLASSHENYVLPAADIQKGMADQSINVFSALNNPHNLIIALEVASGLSLVFILYYFFIASKAGIALNRKIDKFDPYGHLILRVALAVSLLASAAYGSFLGPEVPLSSMPFGLFWRPAMFVLGGFLLLGLFTELAGILGLLMIILSAFVYREQMLTYFN